MSWATLRHYNGPSRKKFGNKQIEELPVQQLSNGAIGIDFMKLSQPPNLANSSVLKMLEEEEHQRKRRNVEAKEVVWPPPQHTEQAAEYYHRNMYANTPAQTQVNNSQGYVNNVESNYAVNGRPVFSPPPTTITLRESVPVNQTSPPIVISQPVTATIKGGAKCRGDQKWPPENYKIQSENENKARIALARGPLFRPKKVDKDYQSFFAQNALPSAYPTYKAPPGTQHYYEEPHATDF